MDNMRTLTMQVDSFLSDRRRHQNLRSIRRVEPEETAIAVRCVAGYELNNITVISAIAIARQ